MNDKKLSQVEGVLLPVVVNVNEDQLRHVLNRFSEVDCVMEAHEFVTFVKAQGGDTTRSLRAFVGWLERAKPMAAPMENGKPRGKLSPEEIDRRVAAYRRNVEGGEVCGVPYLQSFPEEVERLVDEYREALEKR